MVIFTVQLVVSPLAPVLPFPVALLFVVSRMLVGDVVFRVQGDARVHGDVAPVGRVDGAMVTVGLGIEFSDSLAERV